MTRALKATTDPLYPSNVNCGARKELQDLPQPLCRQDCALDGRLDGWPGQRHNMHATQLLKERFQQQPGRVNDENFEPSDSSEASEPSDSQAVLDRSVRILCREPRLKLWSGHKDRDGPSAASNLAKWLRWHSERHLLIVQAQEQLRDSNAIS
jgi:hypothetical protein